MHPASGRPVAVITGASSGIGRATAHAFARRGAAVVLAARSDRQLDIVARECARLGGEALPVPTDVADHSQVHELGRRALARFGRLDVWVNDAGLLSLGHVDETPVADLDRVVRVNLLGCAWGCRTALAHFRRRGRGTLINVASLAGGVGQTRFGAYVASKWAVRGLSESLRLEVADEPGISICTVLPALIDTPIVRHAANRTGRRVEIAAPVHPPERVADTILGLVDRPRAEVAVGDSARLALLARSLLPQALARLTAPLQEAAMLSDKPEAPHAGRLHEPSGDTAAVRGGWLERAPSGERLDTALRVTAAALLGSGVLYATSRLWGHTRR